MTYTQYSKYKDSGIEWLGEMPEDWNAIPVRYLITPRNGIKIGPFGSQLKSEFMRDSGYKVYGQENVINQNFSLGLRYVDDEKFNELSVCEIYPDDIVVTMMGTTGCSQVVPDGIEKGIMDSHLLRIRTDASKIAPYYLSLLIDNALYIKAQIQVEGKGSIMHGLNSQIIKSLDIALPSTGEQTAITSFLDRETKKIDILISKKERQIELLQEKRSALISHAVTKGLNPDVKMKDSGVEWLGEIPEHWMMKKLKYIITHTLVNGIFKKKEYFGSGVKLINVFDVYQDDFLIDNSILDCVEANNSEINKYNVEAGDIFFVRSSLKLEGIARSVCASKVEEPTVFECHIVRARPNIYDILPGYLINYLNSVITINHLISLSNTVTMSTIDQLKIKDLEIAIPPINEQEEIANYLQTKFSKTEALIFKIKLSIEKLREYRTAIISAAVTGKIDVRGKVA